MEMNKREKREKQRLRERNNEGGRKEGRTNKQVKKNQCKEYLGFSYELFLG